MNSSGVPQGSVERYYREAHFWLKNFWGGPSGMIHFGYYPDASTTHEQSLIETVRQVAERLHLEPGLRVLDAGCGMGGAAVWIAENYNVSVHGISIVDLHVETAQKRASGSEARDRLAFSVADYTATGFPDGEFDRVFAIESVCYAREPAEFAREAFRLLKPGGRLVVLDGFKLSADMSPENERIMKSWLNGWGAEDVDSVGEFQQKLTTAGFKNVLFEDLQEHFNPSHKLAHDNTRAILPLVAFLHKLHLASDTLYGHIRAAHDVWLAAERKLCVQSVFSADKPGG